MINQSIPLIQSQRFLFPAYKTDFLGIFASSFLSYSNSLYTVTWIVNKEHSNKQFIEKKLLNNV